MHLLYLIISGCLLMESADGDECVSERNLTKMPTIGNMSSSFIKYTMFTELKLSWSEACSFCNTTGGHLAKIDSHKLDKLAEMTREKRSDIKNENDHRFWVCNCPTRTSEEQSKNCTHWPFQHTAEIQSSNCDGRNNFICEVKTSQPCNFTTIIQGQATLHKANRSECHALCTGDVSCWAVLTFADKLCIQIVLQGHAAGNVTIERKRNCINFEFNHTEKGNTFGGNKEDDCRDRDNRNCCPVPAPGNQQSTTAKLSYPPMFATTLMTMEEVPVTQTSTVTTTVYSTLKVTATTTIHTSQSQLISPTISSNQHRGESTSSEYVDVVDPKTTSKYRRRLSSANHDSVTSRVMGYIAILFVVVPLVMIVLSDARTIYNNFRKHKSIYPGKPKKPKKP